MELDFAKHVDGTDKGDILIFTLSTCGWCMKTKTLLNQLGVRYSYVDVDLAGDDELKECSEVIRAFTKREAYPTIIINRKECIVGYDPDKLKKLLEN